MKKKHFNHIWLILGIYAVWFAVLSGLEEVSTGKFWKVALCIILGIVTYFIIENKLKK